MKSTAAPSTTGIRVSAAGLLALTAAVYWPVSASAAAPEPTLQSALQDKKPLRPARLRLWGFDIYEASLWVTPGFDAPRYTQQAFGLELHYLRGFKGSDIAERSLDEMRNIEPIALGLAARWLNTMRDLFPDVQRGDRITGLHTPGQGAQFFLNGLPLGRVDDESFSRVFFGIWLSPKASQPAIRNTWITQARAASVAPGTPGTPRTP